MELTDAQIERYSRQIILPAIGGRGQQRLLETTIAVIGEGMMARTAALYLTAAGVGALDLHACNSANLGSAREELNGLNPDATISLRGLDAADPMTRVFVCADVPLALLERANRAALQRHAPLIAGVSGPRSRLAIYAGHNMEWPCAACDPDAPAQQTEEAETGAGVIGSLLALEALKAALDQADLRPGRVLRYTADALTLTPSAIGKNAGCRVCTPDGIAGRLD